MNDQLRYLQNRLNLKAPTIRALGRAFGLRLIRNEVLILHHVACRLTGRVVQPNTKEGLLNIITTSVSGA